MALVVLKVSGQYMCMPWIQVSDPDVIAECLNEVNQKLPKAAMSSRAFIVDDRVVEGEFAGVQGEEQILLGHLLLSYFQKAGYALAGPVQAVPHSDGFKIAYLVFTFTKVEGGWGFAGR